MIVDMRTIKDPVDATVHANCGGTFNITLESETTVGFRPTGFDSEYLLWHDEVETWLWKWIQWHPGLNIESSNDFFDHELNYSISWEYFGDIPKMINAFKWWTKHLLSCISWNVCPVCDRVQFKFIDPIDLDVEEEHNCGCGIDQIRRARWLAQRLHQAKITEREYENEMEEIRP